VPGVASVSETPGLSQNWRTRRIAPKLSLGLLVLLGGLTAGPAQGAIIPVTNTNNNGGGSLRNAIISAANGDTITFNIAGTGLHTISPTPTRLLLLTASNVTIDATTQPGWSLGNHNIEINGASAGAGNIGLDIASTATGTKIIGLVIDQFDGAGIRLSSNGNFLWGSYIGTDPTGTLTGRGNDPGVYCRTNNNQIDGTTAAGPNVISGNRTDGVQLDGAGGGTGGDNNVVKGNYIGVDAAGTAGLGNTNQGLAIFNASANNTIGGIGVGNVISGNNNGITMASAGTTGNLIQGNLIGTDVTGTVAIRNNLSGIHIETSAANNTIGGTAVGAGNTIAHNGAQGVWMGNFPNPVGISVLGNSIFGNGTIGTALGIDLDVNGVDLNDTGDGDGGSNNTQNHPVVTAAMTSGAGSATIAGSLNSNASTWYRVEFFANSAPHVWGYGEGQRYLGSANVTTDGSGNAIIATTLPATLAAGEWVASTATVCTNGALCTAFGDTSEFSGNVQAVAHPVVTTTADTLDAPDTSSVANLIANPGPDGRISLREALTAANNMLGLDTITFGIPLTDSNHFYYQDDGVAASFGAPTPTTLADLSTPSSPTITNYDADYPAATARTWYRITLGSPLPAITSPLVLDSTTQPFSITGAGPVIEVNGAAGGTFMLDLQAGSSGSTIRGLVINQVSGEGIRLRTPNNIVAGNFLGTNPAGTGGGPGNWTGVRVTGGLGAADNNRIGGTVAADRNVISGNFVDGVQISGGAFGAANTLVQGNYIGTDVTGTKNVGNAINGIAVFLNATNTLIGGNTITLPGAGNVISGNGGDGIGIGDLGTTGTLVRGNKIGTNAAGTAAISNNSSGVRINASASNNSIGGNAAGAGNLITNNNPGNTVGLAGVLLHADAGAGNAILGNSIYSNGGLGIDLNQDGVTANDLNDADGGPNALLNYPLLTGVSSLAGNLTVNFQLDAPAGSYRIEFFKNPLGADSSLFGEGQVLAGTTNVPHPGGGPVNFSHTFAGNTGDVITATATACTDGAVCAAFGSTSEFAKRVTATPTAVTLQSFTAVGRDRAVELSWVTASELQNLGFHLYRSEAAAGPYVRITTSLIPGLGSSATGQSYSYRDDGLVNGRTYFYELEDIETTGITTRHGPISATASEAHPPAGDGTPAEAAYGDPQSVSLREIERSERHVVLELRTGGFFAAPTADGRVSLRIPGFESASGPGEPSLPMRRAFVTAIAGRKVVLSSVSESDVVPYPGLRPASEGAPSIEVGGDGSIVPARKAVAEGSAFQQLFPGEAARLEATAFQGESKKAEVQLFPIRWDGSCLLLARQLLVRLDFVGRDPRETPLGGARGRRPVLRSSRDGSGVVAQLAVKQPGLYRVDFEELFPAHSPPGTRSGRGMLVSGLRLSRQGQSVAFHAEPAVSVFGPGSSLYFLSEGASLNPYGDAVYELQTNAAGLQMGVESLSPRRGTVDEYHETLEREENHYYQAGLLEAPDPWLWDILVSPQTKSYPFTLDDVLPSSGRVSVDLQGASDFDGIVDHHVRVGVNGTVLGEYTWDGMVARSLDVAVPAGLFHEGENSLDIEEVGDTGASYSMVFLNRFRVEYARSLVARGGQLRGRFDNDGQAVVEGLAVGAVLLDTRKSPHWLSGATLTPSGMSFPVEAGRSYLATSSFLRPQVRIVPPSTLRSEGNRADYLLVAPRAFLAAAQPLLERRQGEGLATKAVSVEEIYEQFGHGEVGPEAIKEFLEYAYQSWSKPSVRYVLLFGDASYDPKDYLGTGTVNWIPGYPVRTSYLWTVSDPGYASVNGEDQVPDVAIGRLSASSVEEAEKLVEKLLAFEDGGGDFAGRAVLVADNADGAGDFEGEANEIASTLFAGRSVERIYYSREGGNARPRILGAFDAGASFLSYVGHGGTAVWASENIFNDWDVPSLAPQSRQPFLMTMNCLNGLFHFPALNSLGEQLVKAEGRGAIAAFSPSGLSLNEPAHRYHKAVLAEILSGRHARLGDAILAAQEDYASSGAFPELLSTYHLLGDPALRIR
jgi:hypothetical protein